MEKFIITTGKTLDLAIAAALEESEAAVKSRYYRLIGRLRKEFGADG